MTTKPKSIEYVRKVAKQKNLVFVQKYYYNATDKSIWECCICGHRFFATFVNVERYNPNNTDCPKCYPKRLTKGRILSQDHTCLSVLQGYGFTTIHAPDLVWQCEHGHDPWVATYKNISSGTGCPTCAKISVGNWNRTSDKKIQYEAEQRNAVCLSILQGYRYKDQNTYLVWQCENGHEPFSTTYSAFTRSGVFCSMCRPKTQSRGESACINALNRLGIFYQREKTFNVNGSYLRYDFYFELKGKKILLEYHGRQHFKYVPLYHSNLKGFKAHQERDRAKEQYALDNGYVLIVLSYRDMYNIFEKLVYCLDQV